jgi:hypothetical protein
MTTQIQLKQIQAQFKDEKCPVFFADAPIAMWCTENVMHIQYRGAHITDPTTGAAEFSPVVEVVLPLSWFFHMQDVANDHAQQLEKQGIKRVPIAAITPTAPGGAAH